MPFRSDFEGALTTRDFEAAREKAIIEVIEDPANDSIPDHQIWDFAEDCVDLWLCENGLAKREDRNTKGDR